MIHIKGKFKGAFVNPNLLTSWTYNPNAQVLQGCEHCHKEFWGNNLFIHLCPKCLKRKQEQEKVVFT